MCVKIGIRQIELLPVFSVVHCSSIRISVDVLCWAEGLWMWESCLQSVQSIFHHLSINQTYVK